MNVRVLPSERDSWKASAHAEGLPVSEWIRRRCGTPHPLRVAIENGRMATQEEIDALNEAVLEGVAVSYADPAGPKRAAKLDPRCVQAQYHWKGFCKVCG